MNRTEWLAYLRSADPEAKELLSTHPGLRPSENDSDLKTRWKDPEFRSSHAAAVRAKWKDPEFRSRNAAAVSAAQIRRWRAFGAKRDG